MKSQTTTVVTRGTTITRGPVSAILVARSSTSLKPWMNITELDTNFGSIRAFHATTSLSTLVYSLITTPSIIKDFMSGKLSPIPGELPTFNDWENHLATIFPEVRLKGNLEMRGADGGPWRRLCALSAFWVKVLIYIEGNEVNEFVGVGGCFGPTLESKEKHANQTRLALADLPHCCSTPEPENKLTEGVMLVHHWGNCSFMAKANVAEAAGASAILIINNRAVGTILCASYWSAWSARETAIEQDKLLKDASEDFSMATMGSTDVVDISNSLCFDCFWFIEVLVVLFAIGGAEGLQTCLVVLLTRPPVNLEFQESRQREAICNSR